MLREARSTNNDYLAFLFFWQIFEVGRGNPIGWINKTLKKKPNQLWVTDDAVAILPLGGKSLGQYLYEDCRCAISHLFKLTGTKRRIIIDTPEDNLRITRSCQLLAEFARFYICDALKLNKVMYLVRRNGRGFPVYLSDEETQAVRCKIAYPQRYLSVARKRCTTKNPLN